MLSFGFQPVGNGMLRCNYCNWRAPYTHDTSSLSVIVTHANDFPNCRNIGDLFPLQNEVRNVCLEVKRTLPSFVQAQGLCANSEHEIAMITLSALGFYPDVNLLNVVCRACGRVEPDAFERDPIEVGVLHYACIPSVQDNPGSRFAHLALVQEMKFNFNHQPEIENWCRRTFPEVEVVIAETSTPTQSSLADVLENRSSTDHAFEAHAQAQTFEMQLEEVNSHPIAQLNHLNLG